MELKKILVTGRREELQVLETRFSNIHFEYKSTKDPLENNKYDGYIGFNLHPELDIKQLKWFHVLMAGVDSLVRNENFPSQLVMTRTIGDLPQKIAEYCLMCVLMSRYKMSKIMENNTNKMWDRSIKLEENKNVLIFGTGQIGSEIARLLNENGFSCYGISNSGKAKPHFLHVSNQYETFKDQAIGWIINALPLTDKTENLFNTALFSNFRNVQFINIGRGKSVVETDLIEAIEEGYVSFSYLDVTREEPLVSTSPLWNYPQILITPHISALTTPVGSVNCAIETLEKVLKDEALDNQVDYSRQY